MRLPNLSGGTKRSTTTPRLTPSPPANRAPAPFILPRPQPGIAPHPAPATGHSSAAGLASLLGSLLNRATPKATNFVPTTIRPIQAGPPSGVIGSQVPGLPNGGTRQADGTIRSPWQTVTTPAKKKPVTPVKAPSIMSPSRSPSRSVLPVNNSPVANRAVTTAQQGVHPVVSAVAQARNANAAAQQQPSGDTAAPDDLTARATNSAALELDPQEAALRQQAAIAQAQFQMAQQLGQNQNQRTINEQQDLYAQLHNQLQGQIPQIGDNYDTASAADKSTYDKLVTALGQTYDSNVGQTADKVNQLGLGAALAPATDRMTADEAFLKNLAGSDSAVQQASLGGDKANALREALANIATQDSAGTNLSGATLRDFQNATTTANYEQQAKQADLQGQVATLEGTRPQLIAENKSKLQDLAMQQANAQAQLAQEQQKIDIQRALAAGTLSKDQADALYKQGTLNIEQQKVEIAKGSAQLAQQKTAAELKKMADAATPGTLEYQKAMAAIALQQSQTQKNYAQTAEGIAKAQTTAQDFGKGSNGMERYLTAGQNTYTSSKGKTGISPAAAAIARHAVQDILSHNSDFRPGAEGTIDKNGQSHGGYAAAVHEMRNKINKNGYDQATGDAMLRALAIAAGK